VRSGLDRAVEVVNENAAIFDRAGVEGVGVASVGGPTIRIFTTNPGVGGLPSRLGGFDVEVIVSGRFDAYADVNSATIGDNVLQPGPFDGGLNPADAIGTLADFEPIKFGKKQTNTIDAAIAITTTADVGNSTPEGGYSYP
jgi:hypothetical protein